jgi:hypothetical protein
VPDVVGYIHFKAYMYLQLGPDAYRQVDALQMPPAGWSAERLAVLQSGSEQIVRWCGVSIDRPLDDLGIGGFYAFVQLFHFAPIGSCCV